MGLQQSLADFHAQYYDILELSDFSIPTFFALGAVFQLALLAFCGPRISAIIPISWLVFRLVKAVIASRAIGKTSFVSHGKGKYVVKLPSETNGVVVFIIGARLNHPFGKLADGMNEIDAVFKAMLRDMENDREAYGFLGRTGTLHDTSDTEGTTTQWITYWKDLAGLQKFAMATPHRTGWQAWDRGKYPYVGLMHELYSVPRGSYEVIYGDFPKWGLGSVKMPSGKAENSEDVLIPNFKGSNLVTRLALSKRD